MRQILFRGKRLDTGEWAEGNYVIGHEDNIEHHYIMPWSPQLQNWPMFEVDPDTVGEFTGLKDKNGDKIYEGDVVAGALKNGVVERGIYEMYNDKSGIPTWVANRAKNSRTGYVLVCDKKFRCRDEVIGNIHDNPELIK